MYLLFIYLLELDWQCGYCSTTSNIYIFLIIIIFFKGSSERYIWFGLHKQSDRYRFAESVAAASYRRVGAGCEVESSVSDN